MSSVVENKPRGELCTFQCLIIFQQVKSHLAKEVSGEVLLEHALLGDEVEEVLARLRPLHDDDEGVVALKVVDESDHAGHVGHAVHEADLQGHLVQSDLQGEERVSRCFEWLRYEMS